MLIVAELLDVGTCWIGLMAILFNSEKGEKYRNKLNNPDGYSPYHAVALGYKGLRLARFHPENTMQFTK